MPSSDAFEGVSNCYVFKSRLQEFAQKVGLPTPVYETTKEGPSHEPTFRSTVIVSNERYDSLPGFFNRKAAEQSAAEVALMQLAHRGEVANCISQPVHETGLCKNLLQEYAQKMNYAIPMYEFRRDETPGRTVMFSCTVEVGGIKYIGAAARTKKEAEIKAARTALLAIQTTAATSESNPCGNSLYTVVPIKKKVTELIPNLKETTAALKPKKGRFKKRSRKKKHAPARNNFLQIEKVSNLDVDMADHIVPKMDIPEPNGFQPSHIETSPPEPTRDSPGLEFANDNNREMGIALVRCNSDGRLNALVNEVNDNNLGVVVKVSLQVNSSN